MPERHNCGGPLRRSQVRLERYVNNLRFVFNVTGQRCTRCGEEVISRKMAGQVEEVIARSVIRRVHGRGSLITLEMPSIYFIPIVDSTLMSLTMPPVGTYQEATA